MFVDSGSYISLIQEGGVLPQHSHDRLKNPQKDFS